ncbi:MAG: cysteine desulfurase [Puniceicoccales bacterium]|nr:cysteine desulfurase [Puniceicoccales bacterium]
MVAPFFPALSANGDRLYLDSAATTLRLRCAMERMGKFYGESSNVHRGLYRLSEAATEAYENARSLVGKYIGAETSDEVIFVRGTTEAINLVAHSWRRTFPKRGDRIMVTVMEHHSNFLPWQLAADEIGADFDVCGILENGELDMDDFRKKLSPRTRMVAVAHVSNTLGTINPIEEIVRLAHGVGALVLVDGAKQSDAGPIDVAKLGCDFYAFSGHKMFAGTGIGILWGRKNVLEAMEPFQLGGGMVERFSGNNSQWQQLPAKFEAGTPNVGGALGLAAAVEFLMDFPWEDQFNYFLSIREYFERTICEFDGLRILGNPALKVGVFSLVSDRFHAHDIATALATRNVCVRAGTHCAQPLCKKLAVPASLRVSFSIYNSIGDAQRFIEELHWALEFLNLRMAS